jgi:hypothetical protein
LDTTPRALNPSPVHALDCALTRRFCARRHEEVRDSLFSLLQSVGGFAEPPFTVEKEVPVGGGKRADILLTQDFTRVVIDVTVVNPTQQLLLADAANNGDAALTYGIARKHEEWDAVMDEMNNLRRLRWELFPFALDTTGRFSVPCIDLLNRFVKSVPGTIPRLKSDINTIISYYTAHMLRCSLQGVLLGGVGGGA